MSEIHHKHYDWSNLITQEDRQLLVKDINTLIEKGEYWENSPKFQTNINIFGHPGPHWSKLKMAFIWSVFAYLGKEVQIKKVGSWGVQTSLKHVEDPDILWHQHAVTNNETISGVFYLELPDDVNDLKSAGTEMAPEGPLGEPESKYYAEWKTANWMVYPGKIYHRPGKLQSFDNRFVVAADLDF